uniref:Uncharacterized protein n=1 Tax=Tanacetum cinerariifolium TaxID=118510 RepID=A0A6L2KNE4_TANCI|nr:hypothetical protein [Tanacetum cinerariifolium]
MNHDHTDELLKDLAEASKKNKKSRDSPNMPPGSPPHQPPPPPPPAGPSGTLGSPRASGSSQVLPPPLPPPSTNKEGQSHGSTAPSSSKTAALAEYKDWTMNDTRLGLSVSSTPEDLHMDNDMAPDAQVHSSDDEDIGNAHIPKNNGASALASTYSPPPEDSLLARTGDMAMFMDWFYKRQEITKLKPQDLEGPTFELVKVFHHNMWIEEECKYDIAAIYGISHWWFQRQQFYIDRHISEGDRRAVRTHIWILSVVRIKVFSMYGYDYMKKIVLRRADLNEHIIAERDFKYLYQSEFEDLYLLNLQVRLISRVLRVIHVVLPEHPSDTQVFRVKMEILLEPTSYKLLVGEKINMKMTKSEQNRTKSRKNGKHGKAWRCQKSVTVEKAEKRRNTDSRDQYRIFEIKDAFGNEQYKPEDIQELFRKPLDDLQNIHEELAEYINSPGWNRLAFYDDDDDDVDYTIAITPVLSTEEPDNSLSMGDEHLDTIPATESDEVIKSSVEDLVPIPSESEGIPNAIDDDSLYNENIEYVEASPQYSELVRLEVEKIVISEDEEIEDDNLREKLLNANLLIANIEALKDNPTPSSKFLTKSSSTSPKSFLEETKTFDNSLLEFENFCFDLEEISSGSTTTHSDVSLSEYDSFIFDLSNDQFPPTDRSDFTHKEFTDELAHIISPPEYDCFYFGNFPDPGEWVSNLNFGICENLSSTTCVNLPVEDDHSPLLAYVVWIFLSYLTYPVIPPHPYSFRNEDTIFDPGITINRFYSFKPGLSHRCGTFKKFNTHRSHLNESPMEMLFSTFFPMDR